jgi:hypothetical protein
MHPFTRRRIHRACLFQCRCTAHIHSSTRQRAVSQLIEGNVVAFTEAKLDGPARDKVYLYNLVHVLV